MARQKTKKAVYILVAIIIILAAAFAYVGFYQAKTTPPAARIVNDTEANNIQQNVTGAITNIRGTLEQLNRSLG